VLADDYVGMLVIGMLRDGDEPFIAEIEGRPLGRKFPGPMALSAGIQYPTAMAIIQLRKITRQRAPGAEPDPVAPDTTVGVGAADSTPSSVARFPRRSDARDWFDCKHARGVRGRTCGAVMA